MVFGWGKKKNIIENNIDEPEILRNSEITLAEIPKILEDIENLRQKTLIAEIKSFRNKIDSDRKNLLVIANQLKNDDLKTDDMDNHIKIILSRAISEVSSTIQKEFQTSFAEINSINDFRRYKNALYEFKPKYKQYDFIVPSKNIFKTIRKIQFFLKK